ncbi:hypothetical protein HYDPIDRAFT_169487 [Hydnomerulius pinastri MD-312]|uniref:Uncharacterized protein n=1 Tax=Hydnomerulius pinastri MD-312 TaxID=994086 RepID=A0A0C9WCT9_9AGAM|nr:hypothetical protein HYDPIDRAFT_30972 [Hydnomerulius pinastri MD-312]KIJ61908.1 hypothetical protein HYDPIDRAFT_169487 [Hydnomerulius pinastri MD-312]
MPRSAAPRTPAKTKKAPAAKGSAKKKTKSDKENVDDAPAKKAKVIVHWAKGENHHITDTLLTLIEDSVVWKGAFGFDKGVENDPTPTGQGKSIIEHCVDIAKVLFATEEKDSEWAHYDLAHLKGVVKNRVMSLKGTYTEFRNKLGETGHGLIVAGREDEMRMGSDIANVYDEIQLKFPWYLRMHALMGTSPVASRKSISNSKSDIDLTVLGGEEGEDGDDFSRRTPTPMEDDDAPLGSSRPPTPQAAVLDDNDEEEADATPLKLRVTLPSKRATDTPLASRSVKKRRTPQDLVKEVADAERETRLAMSTANARERTEREWIKRQSAHDTAIMVERMRLEAQEKQATASRAHDLMMMDRQIELAHINAGYPAPGPIDPRLQG